MYTSRLVFSLTTKLALAALVSASGEPTLEQRLEKLADSLEDARVEAHIPGMSIAIVKDDEIVWARGFGLADVEAARPADENTIYAVGSTTKAFTATLIGMLVDEGRVSWDDPVTDHLPYFDLAVRSEDASDECTLRDLLSHRHGFSRMSILWFGGSLPREEILRTAAGAEPWDDFRANFHYCNVAYLAAGEAAGAIAGATWDEMMADRIFEPLGMSSSSLSVAVAQRDARLALGYEWDEVDEVAEHTPMVGLDSIGPAGSVNSNVLDMAQWVRLQLAEGEVDDMRLVSSERIRDTWTPQIAIAGEVTYGMGWMLREHDGRKVVEHGGNIDGFTAQVSLMPEENVGYVLLMNLDAASLRQPSLPLVFDALLDEWPEENPERTSVATESLELEDYVGTYVANFATFSNEEFEVLIDGDGLALDVPSQRTFELLPPDEQGLWTFALTDQINVSFQRDAQGAVVALTMHQNGFTFEVPRKGVEIEPEVPAAELEKYVGTFVRAQGGKRVKLFIERGRLTMEDKGKHLAFETPDGEGHASLRARADYGATFDVDADGHVASFIFHGSSGDRLFTRLVAEPDADLPTLAEVLALRRTDARIAAIEAAGGTKTIGEVRIAQAGVRGTMTIYTEGVDRYASHLDLGKFGRVAAVGRGDQAWTYNSMRGFDALKGDKLAQAKLDHPSAVEGDWSEYFDSVEVVRRETVDDRPAIVVRLEKGDLPSRTYWVDAEHGDVLRTVRVVVDRSMRLPVTTNYFAFEEADGLRSARRIEVENPETGRTIMTLTRIESGLELGEDVFTLADPDAQH
jgi:CubicO group peptidase (beta-lactamase class C family)